MGGSASLTSGGWRLAISPRLNQVSTFVPVDAGETVIYERPYHAFIRLPIVRDAVVLLATHANRAILAQDRDVVAGQDSQDALQAGDERLFPSDRAIVAFRKWLQTGADARALGPPE